MLWSGTVTALHVVVSTLTQAGHTTTCCGVPRNLTQESPLSLLGGGPACGAVSQGPAGRWGEGGLCPQVGRAGPLAFDEIIPMSSPVSMVAVVNTCKRVGRALEVPTGELSHILPGARASSIVTALPGIATMRR